MAKTFKSQVATGNDLLEGDVVYLTEAGGWTRTHAQAAVAGGQLDSGLGFVAQTGQDAAVFLPVEAPTVEHDAAAGGMNEAG